MEGAEQPGTPAHARMVQLTNANVSGLPLKPLHTQPVNHEHFLGARM